MKAPPCGGKVLNTLHLPPIGSASQTRDSILKNSKENEFPQWSESIVTILEHTSIPNSTALRDWLSGSKTPSEWV